MPTLVIHPGYLDSGPQHWQSRWQAVFPDHRRIRQANWDYPERQAWVATLDETIRGLPGPLVFAAHSLGCITIAHWAALAGPELLSRIKGALLVAPPDVEAPGFEPAIQGFAPAPRARLPFPAVVVASRTDPYGRFERSAGLAADWGAALVDMGDCGHINAESGLEDWPQGQSLLAEWNVAER